MLAEKETLMSECVSSEQKKESIKKQQQLEQKVRIAASICVMSAICNTLK